MVTVRVALRGWRGGPRAPCDWAKVLLTLQQADPDSTAQRPRDQLTTAGGQLVPHPATAAGEHRPAHLPKPRARTALMRCPISLLVGRPTFLWSRGPELKPFFFSLWPTSTTLTRRTPHHPPLFSPPQGDLRKGTLPKIEIRPKCPTRTSPPPGLSPMPP